MNFENRLIAGIASGALIFSIPSMLVYPNFGLPIAPLAFIASIVALYLLPGRVRRARNRVASAATSELAGAIATADGANGSLGLFEDRVRLTHSGVRATIGVGYGAGVKDIALSQITAVQWRDAGDFWLGYIAFSFMGGADPSGGIFDVVKSENAITFGRTQQPPFQAIRADIQARIGRAPQMVAPPQASAADQIRELGSLRDAGLITAEEFDAKKQELLGRF